MDVVSFETAKRLRAAGFPQPRPAFGQAWYIADGPVLITRVDVDRARVFYSSQYGDNSTYLGSWFDPDCAECDVNPFAPTATDILRTLGYVFSTWALQLNLEDGEWEVGYDSHSEWYAESSHQTPAEACAKAWFKYIKTRPATPPTPTL